MTPPDGAVEPVPAGVRPLPIAGRADAADMADRPRDECGVFGVYAPGEDVAKLTYYGLFALQHRGQESAGIAVSDDDQIVVTKEMGLVNQVFTETTLAALQGDLAVGHVRYSTAGSSSWDNAQPQFREAADGGQLALCHNGNLCNTTDVAKRLEGDADEGNDSGLMATLLAQNSSREVSGSSTPTRSGAGMGTADAIARTAPGLQGAFSLVVMDETGLYGVRDRHGVRPLKIGRLPTGGYVLASETAALDIVGAHEFRDVEPGEIVIINADGLRSRRFAEADEKFCLFEWIYLARPDHRQRNATVYSVRHALGRALAGEAPVEADMVIPVPDSGMPGAAGYAQASGLDYAEGLVKNRYVGRTFIEPSQSLRKLGIRLKLNPLPSVVEGKRLVVVDDSIVRGNTSRQLVRMLREAGAAEVHLRITAPPIVNPCYYGIDMATRAQLVAASMSVDEVRRFAGADSLHYLSLDAAVAAAPQSRDELCRACFDGIYPIPVPAEQAKQTEQVREGRSPVEAAAGTG